MVWEALASSCPLCSPQKLHSFVLSGVKGYCLAPRNYRMKVCVVYSRCGEAAAETVALFVYRQGGHDNGINYAYGVTALADDSVVLTGTTNGDFAGAGAHMGGLDFVAIKLTATGVEEWTWQVSKRLIGLECTHCHRHTMPTAGRRPMLMSLRPGVPKCIVVGCTTCARPPV